MNSPIDQLLSFLKNGQEAKISLQRLSEIHNKEDEVDDFSSESIADSKTLANQYSQSISVQNLSFSYGGTDSPMVLRNIDMNIPFGKTTAIVGTSSSGKTTLLKLLLKFYLPQKGEIRIGGIDLEKLSANDWRLQTGVVMQDGYIFSESIEKNITMYHRTNEKHMIAAACMACIHDFTDTQPLGYKTNVGASGIGLSTKQKQRLLIAIAICRNPDFIFFDEATSALDANNEMEIIKT